MPRNNEGALVHIADTSKLSRAAPLSEDVFRLAGSTTRDVVSGGTRTGGDSAAHDYANSASHGAATSIGVHFGECIACIDDGFPQTTNGFVA